MLEQDSHHQPHRQDACGKSAYRAVRVFDRQARRRTVYPADRGHGSGALHGGGSWHHKSYTGGDRPSVRRGDRIRTGARAPYVQSERCRQGIYMKYAKQLIDQGDAYYCFCDKERLESLRSQVARQGNRSVRQALPAPFQGRSGSQPGGRETLCDPYEHAHGGHHLLPR